MTKTNAPKTSKKAPAVCDELEAPVSTVKVPKATPPATTDAPAPVPPVDAEGTAPETTPAEPTSTPENPAPAKVERDSPINRMAKALGISFTEVHHLRGYFIVSGSTEPVSYLGKEFTREQVLPSLTRGGKRTAADAPLIYRVVSARKGETVTDEKFATEAKAIAAVRDHKANIKVDRIELLCEEPGHERDLQWERNLKGGWTRLTF